MVSWQDLPFALRAPAPISLSHFFDGWKQTERRGGRVKGARFWRVHRSEAQTLDSAPALGTLSSEKRGDYRFPSPLLFSGCGFFRAARCNSAASSCFTSLIWSSILSERFRSQFLACRQRPQPRLPADKADAYDLGQRAGSSLADPPRRIILAAPP